MVKYRCEGCGRRYDTDVMQYKCECGGMFDLEYEIPAFDLSRVYGDCFSLFRYRDFLPMDTSEFRSISLGEGMTSTVEFGDDLLLKLDYAMPTLSFKDRGAATVMLHAKNIGVKKVVQDSSGNAGNSIAAYAARAGIECEIFVPKGTSPSKIKMIQSHGAKVVVFDGTRDETADACREYALKNGYYYANHVYNPYFYQGTKTFVYEIYEELGFVPDNFFIPTGNGTLLIGVEIALKELYEAELISEFPKIFIVQSERCAPLYTVKKIPVQVEVKPTLAEGIAIGVPMRGEQILNSDYEGEREVILTPEDGILNAREELAHGGFFVEHTTAAIYAAYLKYKEKNALIGKSVIALCGAGLKSEH